MKSKILRRFLSLFIFLIIISLNIQVMASGISLHLKLLKENGAFDRFGELNTTRTHEAVLNYFSGRDNLTSYGFTVGEISHLKDVRTLLSINKACLLVFLIASGITLGHIYLRSKRPISQIGRSMIESSIFLIIIALALFLFAKDNFASFFYLFHNVLFWQGNWQFESASLLIRMYPAEFWSDLFTRLFIGIMTASLFTAAAGAVMTACSNRKSNQNIDEMVGSRTKK